MNQKQADSRCQKHECPSSIPHYPSPPTPSSISYQDAPRPHSLRPHYMDPAFLACSPGSLFVHAFHFFCPLCTRYSNGGEGILIWWYFSIKKLLFCIWLRWELGERYIKKIPIKVNHDSSTLEARNFYSASLIEFKSIMIANIIGNIFQN